MTEHFFDPFNGAAPQRSLENQQLGPAGGVDNAISGNFTWRVRNVDVVGMKHGLYINNTNTLHIYDYTYNRWDGDGSVHGAGIKIGDFQATNGATYMQRVYMDGFRAPDPTFNVSNTDAVGVEPNSGPLYLRDVTGRNFGDSGGIDTKSGPVYIMNATFESGNGIIKLWEGVEIVLVNVIVNAAQGQGQVSFDDDPGNPAAAGFVRYYNTLWCVNADVPSAAHPNCSSSPSPQHVSGEELTPQQALARVTPLTSNPLPGVSNFFQTQIDEIVLEYSTDAGATWQTMSVPNTGGPGTPPVGDLRYRIPLNLNNANYVFRARYRANGGFVGETSLVINEQGQVVP